MLPRNCTVTRLCLALAVLFGAGAACAGPVGVVSNLNGLLLVKSESGSIRVLASGSSVEEGEVLATRKGTYAQMTLADHTVLALGPDTELTVEKYSFHDASSDGNASGQGMTSEDGATRSGEMSANDGAVLRLTKGRVRVATGILGTRTADVFRLVVESATIDLRRSTSIIEYVLPIQGNLAWRDTDGPQVRRMAVTFRNSHAVIGHYRDVSDSTIGSRTSPPLELSDGPVKSGSSRPTATSNSLQQLRLAQNGPPPSGPGVLAPGLYVQVIDGLIQLSNKGGSQNFSAGQFGFTASVAQPPVILPANPGMVFTPPPIFSVPSTSANTSGNAKPGAVDCVVR